jgi:hypothetical protein
LLINSPTSASVKGQKYWAGFEGEFEKLKVDTSASGMAVFKSTQDSTCYLINFAGVWQITSAHTHESAIGEKGLKVVLLYNSNTTATGNLDGYTYPRQ